MVILAVVIPVRNGGQVFADCLKALATQDLDVDVKLVMDSCSGDGSAERAREAGFRVEIVQEGTFDHGGTRARAVELVNCEIVVMLTQDAVLDSPSALSRLVTGLNDPQVAAVFGRQLPHHDADPLAIHARKRNYGDQSYVTDIKMSFPHGIRKAFLSNSFAAYKLCALREVGSFPSKLILGEDMFVCGKLLKTGYKIAYMADATARHSHNYSLLDEFRRYFDIGVFHSEESWLLTTFGSVEGEGGQFLIDQIRWLWEQGYSSAIPRSIVSSVLKYTGYKLGLHHHFLGPALAQQLAMHSFYFNAPSFPCQSSQSRSKSCR